MPKHNVPLKLRRNVKTGDIALACPFCDAEQYPRSTRQLGSGTRQTRRVLDQSSLVHPALALPLELSKTCGVVLVNRAGFAASNGFNPEVQFALFSVPR